MRRSDGFHVWHTRVAEFEHMSIEDLVKRLLLRETFYNNVEELPS